MERHICLMEAQVSSGKIKMNRNLLWTKNTSLLKSHSQFEQILREHGVLISTACLVSKSVRIQTAREHGLSLWEVAGGRRAVANGGKGLTVENKIPEPVSATTCGEISWKS